MEHTSLGNSDSLTLRAKRPTSEGYFLRRLDQLVVSVLVAISLLFIAWRWQIQGLQRGEMVDLEKSPALAPEFSVDLNSAPWPEWTLLPGVGESLARRIVEDRNRRGPFRGIDDLRRVDGMGPKTLAKIRRFVRHTPAVKDAA